MNVTLLFFLSLFGHEHVTTLPFQPRSFCFPRRFEFFVRFSHPFLRTPTPHPPSLHLIHQLLIEPARESLKIQP